MALIVRTKALAYAACNANIKVLFTTAMDMINNLIAAEADRSLLKKLTFYQTPELLVCDELGYLSLGQQGIKPLLPGNQPQA